MNPPFWPGTSPIGRIAARWLVGALAVVGLVGLVYQPACVVLFLALVPAFVRQFHRPPLRRPITTEVIVGVHAGILLAGVIVHVSMMAFVAVCTSAYNLPGGRIPDRFIDGPSPAAFFAGTVAASIAAGGLAYLNCWLLDRDVPPGP